MIWQSFIELNNNAVVMVLMACRKNLLPDLPNLEHLLIVDNVMNGPIAEIMCSLRQEIKDDLKLALMWTNKNYSDHKLD